MLLINENCSKMTNILDFIIKQNQHERIIFESIKVSMLLNSDIMIPRFQRDKVNEHIDSIRRYLVDTRNTHGRYEMMGVITIGYFHNRFYLIDGQHRYFAIKSLYGSYLDTDDSRRCDIVLSDDEDWNIGITIVRCRQFKEMQEAFLSLNKAVPIANDLRFSDDVDEMERLNDIRSYLHENMCDFFSKSKDTKRANRPNFISVDAFMEMFVKKHKSSGILLDLPFFLEENRKWGEVLKSKATVCWYAYRAIELVNQKVTGKPTKNRELQSLTTEAIKYVKVKKDGRTTEPLYLGCYYFEDDAYPMKPSSEIRCIVRNLWFRFVKEKAGQIPDVNGNVWCVICTKHYVSPTNFHLGHIRSKDHGGLPHIDNLVPICQSCNLTMSEVHMRDYCEKKGLLGWDIITKYLECVREIPNVFNVKTS